MNQYWLESSSIPRWREGSVGSTVQVSIREGPLALQLVLSSSSGLAALKD